MAATALALVALHATLIAVKGAQADCPSVKQVNEAIAARLPGVLVPAEPSPGEGALVLTLTGASPAEERGFTLVDARGETRLARTLRPPGAARDKDCPALAETVALIVERYLQELAYQDHAAAPPPPPESPPRFARYDLFLGATWQPGGDGLAGYEARLGAGRMFGHAGNLAAEITAGMQGPQDHVWLDQLSGKLWRFPVEARLLRRWPTGAVTLEAGLYAGAELFVLATGVSGMTGSGVHAAPVGGLTAGLRLAIGGRGFLRLLASGGSAAVRYSYTVNEKEAFGTQWFYGKMGFEAGLSFW